MKCLFRCAIAALLGWPIHVRAAAPPVPARAPQFDFPIYTNQPPGKQLSGAHAPATTPPLTPEETRRALQVPPGFEVRLFAAEPAIANPVAMTWDPRGRLWVLELYEYPAGAPRGTRGRDRIKILEDTDGDGTADKVTVFADGFSLATGLALGHGGVYLGVAPDLLFLEDTDGDGQADRTKVLQTGFGLQDRHELLNSFAWGPEGWLYLTHGVFTYSKVRDPQDPDDDGVRMDAALARFDPRTRRFEVFGDGTSNPWGVDWDARGEAFVSACVIHHLFHVAPGGQYNRQSGVWANPYGYVGDLPSRGLPAIVNWRHYRAAHSGVCVYQGDQYPAAWRGLVFLGNIHQNALNCDRLTPVGATYRAEKESQLLGPARGDFAVGAGNFLVSRDPWVRPVSVQTGPDGALWVMDWSDRYPCYQNALADPAGVDREHGRIWRVVWVGDTPGKPVPSRPDPRLDLRRLASDELVQRLRHSNSWQRRQARQLLLERALAPPVVNALVRLCQSQNPEQDEPLLAAQLAALAVLQRQPALREDLNDHAATQAAPALRAWAARFTGDFSAAQPRAAQRLLRLAGDADVTVRAAAAVALRQFTSGSLTVNTAPDPARAAVDLMPHFAALLARPSVPDDFYYPHIVWLAMEPRVAREPGPFLSLLAAHDNALSAYCLHRVMRRLCDLTDAPARTRNLNAALEFLGRIAAQPNLAGAALDGLLEAQKAKGAPPTIPLAPIFVRLTAQPVLADRARRLATLYGDTAANRARLAAINDPAASVAMRRQGLQAARDAGDDTARAELLKLLSAPPSEPELQTELVRAVGSFREEAMARALVAAWPRLKPTARALAAEVLVSRPEWSRVLLAAVERQQIPPTDLPATARRTLAQSADRALADQATRLLGRYRASDADKLQRIAAKRQVVLSGEPDLKAGREVARQLCLVCHKLHGEGTEVGPDLTGVGRSTLDALLHNLIDPNEVIGRGYEHTEVELRDGAILSGRLVEASATRLKLLASGGLEHVIARGDIAVENGRPRIRVSELSLMPEGLEQIPDADFRNLIWFLLNPPEDNRPWTPELRQELLAEPAPAPAKAAGR
jgi:putative membrane-bound dehydrogenase-like protein